MYFKQAIDFQSVVVDFQDVYRNYFERLELHTLHNRSGELWSPLGALAAFFEERGEIEGLLEAIARAAESDDKSVRAKRSVIVKKLCYKLWKS